MAVAFTNSSMGHHKQVSKQKSSAVSVDQGNGMTTVGCFKLYTRFVRLGVGIGGVVTENLIYAAK